MKLTYLQIDEWPPLAWLAVCTSRRDEILVVHGSRVETRPSWFCEAVWAGEYAAGDFDRTDIVAGSGGRLRDGVITFVSSGSTCDRLVSLEGTRQLLVANSITCLLAAKGGSAVRTYPRYLRDFGSVMFGRERYQRQIPSTVGELRLTYFDNLSWSGSACTVLPKPGATTNFGGFAEYYDFLTRSMAAVAENAASSARRHRYDLLTTVSSGYDSPAVAALAKQVGCAQAISIDKARDGSPEAGGEIAECLGLVAHVLPREGWRARHLPQIPFLAADGKIEAISLTIAEALLAGKVLLTGYHGDKIWAKDTKDLSENIVRGDTSGLSQCEYRLWVGYLHCPVPFWGARQIAQVNRISHSAELRAWDVPGDYSRPIPRRIAETAGVPREMFGIAKLFASASQLEILAPEAMADYTTWLKRHRWQWLRDLRVPPPTDPALDAKLSAILANVEVWMSKTPGLWRLARDIQWDASLLRRHLFAWATERALERYQTASHRATIRELMD